MLLVGRYTKEVKINFNPESYANTSSFTKLLHSPVRDTSLPAAQRAKSALKYRLKTSLEKQRKKLESFKEKLSVEKHQFEEFEKYKCLLDRVDKIITNRWELEQNSAILIQSAFRGFVSRKIYFEVIAI